MRLIHLRIPLALVALSSSAMAQVSLSPKRFPAAFPGELPLVWTVEGQGALQVASLRVMDETGKERLAPLPMPFTRSGDRNWRIWDSGVPADRFKGVPAGRYIAEWTLTWRTGEGLSRTEKTEIPLRLGEEGDGWLQTAYLEEDGQGFHLDAATAWGPGRSLAIAVKPAGKIQAVRYQVIGEDRESILRPWAGLPLSKGNAWSLPWDAKWPAGPVVLWVEVQDGSGAWWIQSREIWSGNGREGQGSQVSSVTVQKTRALGGTKVANMTPLVPVQLWPNADWLGVLSSVSALPWEQSNRIATVTVGYVDEERNDTHLWPTDAGRPMSLGITAADLIGKPMYSVSYLLADKASSATDLPSYAQSALSVNGNSASLPAGAQELSIGHVKAPVVFGAGVIEDFLGKPLAAGYGWAAHSGGVPVAASDWTGAPNNAPDIGLAAIEDAATLRAQIIQDSIASTGYQGAENAALDSSRDPYALTVASQDPLSRPILSKALGSAHQATASPVVVLAPPAATLACAFDGDIPGWIQANGRAGKDATAGAPARMVLQPSIQAKFHVGGTYRFRSADGTGYTNAWDSDIEPLDAGVLNVVLGRAYPGASISATFATAGPVQAVWVVDGKDANPAGAWTDSGTRTVDTSALSLTVPAQIGLKILNSRAQLPYGQTPAPADLGYVSNLTVQAQFGALGLDVDPAILAHPVVPGYSRTQYGTVDIPTQGRCSVTMVTDPDGSAVAEVKDPEGRTVYKVVNPDSSYTNQFFDYLGSAFQPSAPKARGAGATGQVTPTQQNLLTQYLFDDQGHLRAVVPPKAISGWGFALSDAAVTNAFAWTGTAAPASPIAYATYNAYDESGHLIASYNPDEGLTLFKVDQKGRVHYSQTASQRGRSVWTRTLYDAIYRVVAIGETGTVADVESLPVVTPANYASLVGSLDPAHLSVNTYDAYLDDPTTDARLDSSLRSVLPGKAVWGDFADGHLVQTKDPRVVERYFYDQDGRIAVRWVSISGSDATVHEFAIGIFYDFAGRVKRLIYPAGPAGGPLQVVYTYDELGRLFAVGTPSDKGYFARYAYQPTGELRAIIYGPGEGFVAKRMLTDPQGWLRETVVQSK